MSKTNREQGQAERAAAVQAAQARAERNQRMALVAGVVIALAAIVAGGFWYTSGTGGSTGAPTVSMHVVAGDHALVIGKASAKYDVVVYEDFLCPYCREFEEASRDYLHSAAADGLIQVEYRPFHLLPESYSVQALNAFAAVLAQGPAKALKFHDLLYDKQPYEAATTMPDAAQLASWAASIGANKSAVEAAVNANDPSYVTAADAAASKAKVTGTPTVYLNGKQVTGASPTAIADSIQQTVSGGH